MRCWWRQGRRYQSPFVASCTKATTVAPNDRAVSHINGTTRVDSPAMAAAKIRPNRHAVITVI